VPHRSEFNESFGIVLAIPYAGNSLPNVSDQMNWLQRIDRLKHEIQNGHRINRIEQNAEEVHSMLADRIG
jgi:hypothetical protein